jgi:hypothetical protein
MNAEILPLNATTPKPRRRDKSDPAPAAQLRAERKAAAKDAAHEIAAEKYSAAALGSVALVLTGLSLEHLATGIEAITHCSLWQGYASLG